MRFMAVLSVVAQVAMVLYVTRAACMTQREDKRGVIRAASLTSIAVIVMACAMQLLTPNNKWIAVREVAEIGYIGACIAVVGAVYLLKRSLEACDQRSRRNDAGR